MNSEGNSRFFTKISKRRIGCTRIGCYTCTHPRKPIVRRRDMEHVVHLAR